MKKVVRKDLGLMRYQEAWDLQEKLFAEIVDQKMANRKRETAEQIPPNNYLLTCEHPPVFTLGKSGKMEHLLRGEEELRKMGVDFYRINRGGDITYHGPGQLVIYPILDLDQFFTDIHKYLRFLENAVIETLAEYGIQAGVSSGETGVWIDSGTFQARKICAMGVRAARWVTMHGLALNINTDLQHFSNIIPCGIRDKAVTSMQKELGKEVDFQEVKEKLSARIGEAFGMNLT